MENEDKFEDIELHNHKKVKTRITIETADNTKTTISIEQFQDEPILTETEILKIAVDMLCPKIDKKKCSSCSIL